MACSVEGAVLSFDRVKSLRSRREMGVALRVLIALVVWLSVGGHVSGLAHFALVSHHVCATHGEVEHGDDHAHAPDVARPTASTDATQAAPSLGAALGAEDEHDDCSVLARQKEQPIAGAGTTPVLAPAPLAQARSLRRDHEPYGMAPLLALAPKTSPPV
jgi:hypothetical protein